MDDLPPPDPNLFEINKNPAEPSKWGLKAMSKSQDLHWDWTPASTDLTPA